MKRFNTTGLCNPEKHYMVDISARLTAIGQMVDRGDYFVINRARQYGKTTTLTGLEVYLKDKYVVVDVDFQEIGSDSFKSEGAFCKTFSRTLLTAISESDIEIPESAALAFQALEEDAEDSGKLDQIFQAFSGWCKSSGKPLVLMIDEVDSAANNQVFLDFLSQLRSIYLKREKGKRVYTFQAVILAGVTDVKHLRSKIREEDQHKVNSPWNIAADFKIDMSLSEEGIRGMLGEYEADHQTGMDIPVIAKLLRDYTGGYPFLVSRICQLIDEDLMPNQGSKVWSISGFHEAIRILLSEKNTLFESLTGKLSNYPELREVLRSMLMEGVRIPYNPLQESISQMEMYGFIVNQNNVVAIANRIFETLLYNLFLSDEELKRNFFGREGDRERNLFVEDGILNMRMVLEHFGEAYERIGRLLEEKLVEKDGRELFLLYLKPIINGTGNYYIEAETRDQTRTDVIVDYLGKRYIVEMKIWRGPKYHETGEKQLKAYLDSYGLDTGYLLTFSFLREKEQHGITRVLYEDKVLYEMTV